MAAGKMDQPGPKAGDSLGTRVTLVLEGFVPKGMEVLEQQPGWLNAGEAARGSDPVFFSWRVWAGCKHLPALSFPVRGVPRALRNAAWKAERGKAPFLLSQPWPCAAFRAQQDPWHSHGLDNWLSSHGETEAG